MYTFFNLFFAPGVMLHELAHALFCLLAGVKIFKIKLFQFDKVAGYVTHEEPKKFLQSLLISFGPILVNTLVSLVCFSRFYRPYNRIEPWLLLWLGVASGLHAIPSDGDADTLLSTINARIWRNPLVAVGYPFVLLLYILNFLKRWRADFVLTLVLFWLGAYYLKTK